MPSQVGFIKVKTPRSLLPPTAHANQFTPAEMLKKFWDNCHRNTMHASNTQDISDELNPDYSPPSTEYIALFDEKQKFICSVFDKVLHTDRGKNNVREYEHDFNDQEIYKKLLTFCTESIKARVNVTEILSCFAVA